ncbi:MAG TPA: type II toxin-antitoxin system ParD family antitoxin [Caulobacteraceae bacterium]|nr:type II toxin-antitoxin system ParD family antitoxin [Caulobacteraceae bacterium]
MAAAEKLNVTVPADLARMVREKVKAGAYASDSEVVGKALRLLKAQEAEREAAVAEIRVKIQEALDDPRPNLTSEQVRQSLEDHHRAWRPKGERGPED